MFDSYSDDIDNMDIDPRDEEGRQADYREQALADEQAEYDAELAQEYADEIRQGQKEDGIVPKGN